MVYAPTSAQLSRTGLIASYMRACGFYGWASFWRVIYVLPGWEGVDWLIRHEAKHLEQIERDGRMMFTARYLWWLVRFGYWNNPYEIEARAAEQERRQLPPEFRS